MKEQPVGSDRWAQGGRKTQNPGSPLLLCQREDAELESEPADVELTLSFLVGSWVV